jgi:serine/threonine transporter
MATPQVINRIMSGSLVLQIAVGIVAGIALSLISPEAGKASMLLGNLFVQALKAVAPVLVRPRSPTAV